MIKLNLGIFGPGLCGKTFVAKAVSRTMFIKHGYRSLALDSVGTDFGDHCTTFDAGDPKTAAAVEAQFWGTVWASERCFVMVDEASETIGRDKELIPLFTRIRHNGHKLCVMGHSAADLLPTMRRQFHALYVFQQTEKAAELLYEDCTFDKGILACEKLGDYEFLYWEKGKPIQRCKLKV